MLTIVFLVFVAMFAIAGIFISLAAKKGKGGQSPRPMSPRNDKPAMERATSDKD